MLKNIKQQKILFVVILIIIFTRLLIFNKEAVYFWADESRYPILINNIEEAFKTGNYLFPLQQIFNIDARPGAGFFYYLPAFFEWRIPNINFALYYNLIINSLSLILIFLIIKKYQNLNAAILVILILAFSVAPVIYIRHTLPYDIALFLLLLGAYIYTYFQRAFIFGLFAGFSFLTYPSYYYYILPIPFLLLLYLRSVRNAALFIIGVFVVLFSTQLFSIFIDRASYFQSLGVQSGGVTAIKQGDYIPAISFIWEYIQAVDGYWGIFLVIIIFPLIFLLKDKKKIVFFSLYLFFVFLILESFSHVLQKHVLYGRTIRPLYILSLVLSILTLERLFSSFKSKQVYLYSISIFVFISLYTLLPKFFAYKNLIYPNQFKQNATVHLNSKGEDLEIEEALFVNYWDTEIPDPKLVWHFFKPGEGGKYYIMNAIQTFPYFGNLGMDQFCRDFKIILKEEHIQYIFKPARFEGYSKDMREAMDKYPLYYQLIYCPPQ